MLWDTIVEPVGQGIKSSFKWCATAHTWQGRSQDMAFFVTAIVTQYPSLPLMIVHPSVSWQYLLHIKYFVATQKHHKLWTCLHSRPPPPFPCCLVQCSTSTGPFLWGFSVWQPGQIVTTKAHAACHFMASNQLLKKIINTTIKEVRGWLENLY